MSAIAAKTNDNLGRRHGAGRLRLMLAGAIVIHTGLILLLPEPSTLGPAPEYRIQVELSNESHAAPGSQPPSAANTTAESRAESVLNRPLEEWASVPSTESSQTPASAAGVELRTARLAQPQSVDESAAPILPVQKMPDRSSHQVLAFRAPGRDGLKSDSAWKNSVRVDLRNWLERYKRYPLAARRKGVQGSVLVRFVINHDGKLLEKELLKSSGSRHLDAAAMKLLSRAAPYPQWPAQTLADALEVQLPIEYRLVVSRPGA